MASLFSTGPAHLYVMVPAPASQTAGAGGLLALPGISLATGAGTLRYLGTAKTKPRISLRRGNKPVFNDITGEIVPMDKMYLGQEAYVFADLNRFNQATMELVADSPVVSGTPGLDGNGDVGTLWITEGLGITLIVQFPYATKASMRAQGLFAGYRFQGAIYEGPEDQEAGTTDYTRPVVFHCLKPYNKVTGTGLLYDHVVTNLPPIE